MRSGPGPCPRVRGGVRLGLRRGAGPLALGQPAPGVLGLLLLVCLEGVAAEQVHGGGQSAQPVGRGHLLLARRLHAAQADCTPMGAQPGGPAGRDDGPGGGVGEVRGPAVGALGHGQHPGELEAGGGGVVVAVGGHEPAPRPRLGGDPVDPGGHGVHVLAGVHEAIGGGELGGVRGLTLLRDGDGGAGGEVGQDLQHERSAALGEVGQDLPRGLPRVHRTVEAAEDGPGVQALLEPEDVRADGAHPVHQGPLHGGGAAVGGQAGEVQVEPAVRRDLQGVRGHERPVGHDDGHVRGEGAHLVEDGGPGLTAQAVGLEDGHPGRLGGAGHRGRGEHPLAAHGRVGAGEHADDLVLGAQQRVQHGHRGLGGAGVEHAQRTGGVGSGRGIGRGVRVRIGHD